MNKRCISNILGDITKLHIKDLRDISKMREKDRVDCPFSNNNQNQCESCILMIVNFLELFGLLSVENRYERNYIKLSSEVSKLMILSLKEYFENDLKLIDHWDEVKGLYTELNENTMFSGTTFLYEMERQRINALDNPKPIKYGDVAKVFIKSKIKGEDCFLFQFDSNVSQYKLIGGMKKSSDKDIRAAMIREIKEELHKSNMIFNKDYKLTKISEINQKLLSKKFGAYCEYNITFFHAYNIENKKLKLSNLDRWISVSEIKNGRTNDDQEIFPIEKSLLDLVNAQNYSFCHSDSDKTIFKKMLNKVESDIGKLIMYIIAIVGFVITVFTLFS